MHQQEQQHEEERRQQHQERVITFIKVEGLAHITNC